MSVSIPVIDVWQMLPNSFAIVFITRSRMAPMLRTLPTVKGVAPPLIVILSDVNMPGMDGLELLGEIKRRWPKLPVIMVTAYDDNGRRRRASELGARGFLTKPVDFDYLKAQLQGLPIVAD